MINGKVNLLMKTLMRRKSTESKKPHTMKKARKFSPQFSQKNRKVLNDKKWFTLSFFMHRFPEVKWINFYFAKTTKCERKAEIMTFCLRKLRKKYVLNFCDLSK